MSQTNSYSKNRTKPQYQAGSSEKCWACGGQSHGKLNDRNTRTRLCEAWSSTCTKCSIKGHYPSCCSKCATCNTWGHRDGNSRWCPENPRQKGRSKKKPDETLKTEDDAAAALYDQLCAIDTSNPIEHHIFDGKWVARPSKPHPVLTVRLTLLPQDHEEFGCPLKASNPTPVEIPMIADTGCQSNIIPLRTDLAMGVAKSDIVPVKLTMRGAISEDMGVEGGIFTLRSTKQMVYTSNKVGKAFLSEEALIALGVMLAHRNGSFG